MNEFVRLLIEKQKKLPTLGLVFEAENREGIPCGLRLTARCVVRNKRLFSSRLIPAQTLNLLLNDDICLTECLLDMFASIDDLIKKENGD